MLPLEDKPPSLLSSITSGHSDVRSDDRINLLGDSTHGILGGSTLLTSDNGDRDDNTDSVVSLDEHVADDVVGLADTEASEGTASTLSRSDSRSYMVSLSPGTSIGGHSQRFWAGGVTLRG